MPTHRLQMAKTAKEVDTASAAPDPDLGWLENSVGFHMRAAQESAANAFAARVGAASASPSHLSVLSLLASNPGMSQTVLARATRRDISSMTSALDDLCRRGLVVRERQEHDRRTYCLSLTPAGRRTLRKLMEQAVEHERMLDQVLGRDREAFLAALQRIAAAFKSGA